MEKPRILLISSRSDLGGGPKYMLEFAKAIMSEVDVFIASPLDQPFGTAFQNVSKAHFQLARRSFNPVTFLQLLYWMKKNKIRTVHSHGRGAGFYSRLLKPFGFKVIHTFHGVHRDQSISGKLKFWMDRLLAPLTDHFIFVSNSELNSALKAGFKGIEKSPILQPIVYPPKVEMSPRELRSPIRLGSIARLDPAKGVDQLLEHLSNFKIQNPTIHWTYTHAGSGDQPINIPQNIKDQVKFLGKIDSPYDFLKNIDLYLACSRNEAFNISVLEALYSRLPCLISNVPGHEVFINARVADGFQQNNLESFSEKLLLILNKSNSHQSNDDFLHEHSPEIITTKCQKIILKLING